MLCVLGSVFCVLCHVFCVLACMPTKGEFIFFIKWCNLSFLIHQNNKITSIFLFWCKQIFFKNNWLWWTNDSGGWWFWGTSSIKEPPLLFRNGDYVIIVDNFILWLTKLSQQPEKNIAWFCPMSINFQIELKQIMTIHKGAVKTVELAELLNALFSLLGFTALNSHESNSYALYCWEMKLPIFL